MCGASNKLSTLLDLPALQMLSMLQPVGLHAGHHSALDLRNETRTVHCGFLRSTGFILLESPLIPLDKFARSCSFHNDFSQICHRFRESFLTDSDILRPERFHNAIKCFVVINLIRDFYQFSRDSHHF